MVGESRIQENDAESVSPRVHNPNGSHRIVLVCEHASQRIPDEFQGLGLEPSALDSHIAWDPGAFDTAKQLSMQLDAPLVHSTVSRLVYDCNRPPESRDAMLELSAGIPVSGNVGLTSQERQARVERFYRPFETLLADTLFARGDAVVLATVHSFTPVYRGHARSVEIGILHDSDSRLADAVLEVASGFEIERNAPYGPDDGVTHTLRRHALPRQLLNVMIEIRSDLISTQNQCAAMAERLADWLTRALDLLADQGATEARG